METEDVIELGSSDEEPGPPPPKKMNVRNAMVHIPTKIHGVTIKPVKLNSPDLPKLGKNITITKTMSNPACSMLTNKIKPPEKLSPRLATVKKKIVAKKPNPIIQTKAKVFNPLSQIKKGTVPLVGSSLITSIRSPIQIKKPQLNRPQPLQRLPPSITIKKTGTMVRPAPNLIALPKAVPKAAAKAMPKRPINLNKKRKIEEVPTVELDDEETSVSAASSSPQWYVRPEEQITKAVTQEEIATSQEESGTLHENTNNKEPQSPKFIEITIEDSPVKPAKTKRTRELSTEKVITIDDSPNKGGVISDDVAEGSDNEATTSKKVPQSKKKLNYTSNLQRIEETHTLEIEFEPLEPNESNIEENQENNIISISPGIVEAEEESIETALNKEEDLPVVQIKPVPSKRQKSKEVATKREHAIESEFHPVYESFINLCFKLENSNDMEKIIEKKIKTYYRQVSKEYRESDEFLDMVASKITAMEAAPAKMYLYIKDIVDELNHQRKLMKEVPAVENKSKDQDSFLYGKEKELDPSKQRQIRKLEKTLKKLNRAIQKLENQEVDFDDEEDSVYLLTEKYKERMVRVHTKFCQLTNTKMPSQPRVVLDTRPGVSSAPVKRLEAFINKKDAVVFPDFHDVLRCVREAVDEGNLGWNEAFIMEEARDLFMRCGRKLQRRRQENEWRLATSRITANSDPAEQSEDLKKQLDANRRVANTKESEVFNKFCDRQSLLKLEAEEIDDKDAEESPVESEEEDNDEVSSLESKQRRKERLRRLLQEQSKKNNPNKVPQTEQSVNKEIEIVINSDESVPEKKSETVNEDDKIQTLSDDSNEIGSDMDELHLLQKLHSDSEVRRVSTSESSGSETPIAISDTLDSSSDDEKQIKLQLGDIISIENSSYSDESDTQKNNKLKRNKKYTVASKELVEENQEIECSSSSIAKNTHANDNTIENTVITSSDDESNADDNINSGKSDSSSKSCTIKEGHVTSDKNFELGIMSESAELYIEINECAKPSDAEDEQSLNSDIVDNRPSSSTSSGQYEELLKEHNDDPLLKLPELLPRDPSDKLFDKLVMKHYNDPLVKKHLKGSDSSNNGDADNYNSDSLNTSETGEEAKKDLIETSVDTEELNCNSPSIEIVDKFIEKLKQSDISQSSDELQSIVDKELDLLADVRSPVSLALEKEVTAARQTKAWPKFRDECSLSSDEDDNTGDTQSMPTKINDTTNDNTDAVETAESEVNQAAIETNATDAWSFESTKCASEKMNVPQIENEPEFHSTEPSISSSTDKLSKEMDAAHSDIATNKARKNADAVISTEANATHNEAASTEEKKDTDAGSAEYVKNKSKELGNVDIEMACNEANIYGSSSKSTKGVSEAMDIAEIGIAINESVNIATCSTQQAKEVESEELIADIVPLPDNNETSKENLNHDENKIGVPDSIVSEENCETDNNLMQLCDSNHELEEADVGETEAMNGSLNINMDISDLHDSDINLSQKNGGSEQALDNLSEHLSVEKGECGEEVVPRTINSMCLQSVEGND